LVEGSTEFHKEGAYYIEWYAAGKRRRESVGRNPLDAFAAAERKEQILKNAALGIQVVGAAARFKRRKPSVLFEDDGDGVFRR
jgi:hypothetical protein